MTPVHDYAGYVCNYADATGDHLPLVATLNAARNLDLGAALLGCTHAELSELALQAPPGAEGLTLLPYFQGERTPDLPHARGSLLQASMSNFTRPNFARAVIEGTLVSQVVMIDALRTCGVHTDRLMLIGGAAKSPAIQKILPQLVDVPVLVPDFDEYVTRGAAMQAISALTGFFPTWAVPAVDLPKAALETQIGEQHMAARAALGYHEVVPVHG